MWEMTFVDEKVGEYLPDGEILYDDNYQNTHHEVKTGWIKLYQIQGFFFFSWQIEIVLYISMKNFLASHVAHRLGNHVWFWSVGCVSKWSALILAQDTSERLWLNQALGCPFLCPSRGHIWDGKTNRWERFRSLSLPLWRDLYGDGPDWASRGRPPEPRARGRGHVSEAKGVNS